MTAEEIMTRVKQLGTWFHNLDLNGVPTAPSHFLGDYPSSKFRRFAHVLPDDLRDITVLDVGCNAGFYSMEMLRRGAGRVVGIDFDPRYLAQAQLAADVLGYSERLELRRMSVYDVAQLGERFDLVIFMGVLYHLRHPLLALDLLHEHVTRDLMLFQSLLRGSTKVQPVEDDYSFSEEAMFERPGFPSMAFIERKYSGDPTNWWFPNRAGVEAMLRSSGYDIVEHAEAEVYLCRHRELTELEQIDRAVYPSPGT